MAHEIEKQIDALEGRLLAAWVNGPAFRTRWTPEPTQFWSTKSQAIARACSTLAQLGMTGTERGGLGVPLVAQLASCGDLAKNWGLGESPLPVATVLDPGADLESWRNLKCLKALRDGAAEVLSQISASSDLDAVRGKLLEATTKAYVRGAAATYSDEQLMAMALRSVTRQTTGASDSGFQDLDQITGGVRPGHVWALGAPTNFGKTSLLLAMADHHLTAHKASVLFVTCEDDPEMISVRLACRRSGVKGTRARDARLSQEEVGRINDELLRAKERGKAPVMLDGRGRPVEQIAEDIKAHVAAHGTRLVLVDYLQCITAERVSQDRRAEINHIGRTLTDAIKTSGAAGVLASQLTNEDLRESRDLEHAAEVVLIGRKTEDGALALLVKKNKTGPAGALIELQMDPITGAFLTERPRSDVDHLTDGFEDSSAEPYWNDR